MREIMLKDNLLEKDEEILMVSQLDKGFYVFQLIFGIIIFLCFLFVCYIFLVDTDKDAFIAFTTLLTLLFVMIWVLIMEKAKKLILTNKHVIIKDFDKIFKYEFSEIVCLDAFTYKYNYYIKIATLDKKRFGLASITNNYELVKKFKELCPSYKSPERWTSTDTKIAIGILILVTISPIFFIIYFLLNR